MVNRRNLVYKSGDQECLLFNTISTTNLKMAGKVGPFLKYLTRFYRKEQRKAAIVQLLHPGSNQYVLSSVILHRLMRMN